MEASIKTYSHAGIEQLVREAGQPSFRTRQLLEWLYVHQAASYDEMSNLPKSLRSFLEQKAPLTKPSVVEKRTSSDGTRKYVLSLSDGSLVETVGIPSQASHERLTVCFSTQVGCAMTCAFCATGQEGFSRNLGAGEIVDQVLVAQDDFGRRVTNLVAMGQGEPFLNYEQTMDALHILNNPKGIAIGARKITVSTCGIVPGIEKFSQEPEQFTLAVSLHSARQEIRNMLMPRMEQFPLSQLKKALLSYCEHTNRRITLEYLLIEGVNDSPKDAEALLGFCDGMLCHVNILPMNKVEGALFQPSSPETVGQWLEALERSRIEATVRSSRGSDIEGACGQLKNAVAGTAL